MVDIFKEELNVSQDEKVPSIDRREFIKVVESRRSVRVYNDEKIPEEDIQKCLDLALLAPNSSNLQATKKIPIEIKTHQIFKHGNFTG